MMLMPFLIIWVIPISIMSIFYVFQYQKITTLLEKDHAKKLKSMYGLSSLPLLTFNPAEIKKRSAFYKDLLFTDRLSLSQQLQNDLLCYRILFYLFLMVYASLMWLTIYL